jgi:hypothetical protein
MPKQTTLVVDKCTPEQLKELLKIAADKTTATAPLLKEVGNRRVLIAVLAQLSKDSEEAIEMLLQTACDAQAPLSAAQTTKELAKLLLDSAAIAKEKAAATFLYHLAVAAAIAFHGVNIASRSGKLRLPLYRELAAALGDDPLGEVFATAADKIASEACSDLR